MTLSSRMNAVHNNRQEPYFHHGNRLAPPGPTTLQPLTRYLCGAAYVEEKFVDQVIGEVIEDEHRAVAPSYEFDLDPVVRHCFRARRLWLAQNAALTAVVVIALWFVRVPTILLLAVMLVVAIPMGINRHSPLARWKLVGIGLVTLTALPFLLAPVLTVAAYTSGLSGTGFGSPESGYPGHSQPDSPSSVIVRMLLVALALGGTLTLARYTMLKTLTTDLAPGVVHQPPTIRRAAIAERLTTVTRAQRGNIAMHAGYNPFLGAGEKLQAWSVVVELLPGNGPKELRPQTADPVDPVELNRHVKQRLAALRSDALPERQRVSGLRLRDYVVASGSRWRDYPLVDPQRVPFSVASPDAVAAIIRHPQASARHFLRATTGTEGKTVVGLDGGPILLAENQEVQVSAFIHIAVEGGLLYVEYVSTVMGAIRTELHEMDELPTAPADLVSRAVADALRRLTLASVMAPVHLVAGLFRAVVVTSRMNAANRRNREAPVYNYGARISVRDIASQPSPDTYTRQLDAQKYSKLIERRVNDAVLDYLEAQNVDTGEYRSRVNVIHNQNTYIQDSTIHGPVAAGPGAQATMNAASTGTGQGE